MFVRSWAPDAKPRRRAIVKEPMVDTSTFFDYPTGDDGGDAVAATEEPFLSQCSSGEWELIRGLSDNLAFGAGADVIAAGSTDRALLLVLSGTVDVDLPAGRRRTRIATLGIGAVLGELGFLDGRPADARVRARTDCTVLRLPLDRFDQLAAMNPTLGLYLLFDVGRVLAGRLRRLEGRGTI
jgi:signal-transduction protein with cAMP-binding, CBS, and nucleotidyltransferase domain